MDPLTLQLFEKLPDEKVIEICREMDDITLARFIRSSEQNRRICSEVLQKRKQVYLDIFKAGFAKWAKNLPDGTYSEITYQRLSSSPQNISNVISQHNSILLKFPNDMSIFPSDIDVFETGDQEAGRNIIYRSSYNLSENQLIRIIKNIQNLGYTRIQ